MKKKNKSWKQRQRKQRCKIPHYPSPLDSVIAMHCTNFDIYQLTKGHDNRFLTTKSWKYSSSKRTLQC